MGGRRSADRHRRFDGFKAATKLVPKCSGQPDNRAILPAGDKAQATTMARILLVDDDPDVRPLLEHIIFTEGHQVSTAESVKVGRLLLGKQPYDLLITDVNLPDGSGLSLADEAIAAGIKTLVLTGHGLKLKPGVLNGYTYLLKPIRVAELVAVISERLAQKNGDANIVPFPKPN
jgi:two-component system, NtrC family, response regulator PilR